MSNDDMEKQGAAPDQATEKIEEFKKNFNKSANDIGVSATAKWPNENFDKDVDKLFEFAEKGLKTLTKGNVVLDFVIDFLGKVFDTAAKFGLEKLQEFLGSKINKAVKEDPELKKIIPQEKKEEIQKLDDKIQERAKNKEKTVSSPSPKAMADSIKNSLQHSQPQSVSAPARVERHVEKSAGHGGR